MQADEVYLLVAWLLNQNHIIGEGAILDAHCFPKIEMPNRNGFIADPRPGVHGMRVNHYNQPHPV